MMKQPTLHPVDSPDKDCESLHGSTLDSDSSSEDDVVEYIINPSSTKAPPSMTERTCAVGIIVEDAVILAAYCGLLGDNIDRDEDDETIKASNLTLACCITGNLDAEELKDFWEFWEKLDAKRRNKHGLLEDVAKSLYRYHNEKGLKSYVEILVAGWHRDKPEDALRPRLATVNAAGWCVDTKEFSYIGARSGARHVQIPLSNGLKKEMKVEAAVELAEQALLALSYLNVYSEGFVDVLIISAEGFCDRYRKSIGELHSEHSFLKPELFSAFGK